MNSIIPYKIYNDIESNNIENLKNIEKYEQEINKLIKNDIINTKKLERYELEINKLNKEVFGNPFLKFISNLFSIVLTIILYLRSFDVIDNNLKLQ